MSDKKERLPTWIEAPAMQRVGERKNTNHVRRNGLLHQIPSEKFEYWLKPNGNVTAIPMYSSRNLQGMDNPSGYESYTRRNNIKRAFIPWEFEYMQRCLGELRVAWLDNPVVSKYLMSATEDEWDVARHEIQDDRLSAHDRESEKYRAAWATEDAVAAAKTDRAMAAALERVASLVTAPDPTPAKAAKKTAKKDADNG